MSKGKIILLVIGVVIIAGLVYLGVKNPGEDTTGPNDIPQGGEVSGTIGDLLTRDGNWKCTWERRIDSAFETGSIYVSGGKFKSDIESAGSGTSLVAHALSDGTDVYTWTNLAPYGVKIPLAVAQSGDIDVNENPQGKMFTDTYEFDCEPWTADATAFEIPSGITFTEVPQQ